MNSYRSGFGSIPPVVKNLLIINVLFFLATIVMQSRNDFNLNGYLGLYYPASESFKPVQFITYMFLHGDFMHLFFNMFALYMFGQAIETVWGPKKFFIYYFITGIGAALVHMAIAYFQASNLMSSLTTEEIRIVYEAIGNDGAISKGAIIESAAKLDLMRELYAVYNTPMVGASGAVFGLLLAFGMMFPNTQLMLLFPPIPIKAKYFVIIYGIAEFYFGINNSANDNVAHFAHLGGMLFGFILIMLWNKHKFKRLN
ncbi:MAG: rhomboid family intramembrane serine protease [Bacteroidales bacterium]|nr:rhomboid family intramembrane serine protease [Bacteroidales bacterium]